MFPKKPYRPAMLCAASSHGKCDSGLNTVPGSAGNGWLVFIRANVDLYAVCVYIAS